MALDETHDTELIELGILVRVGRQCIGSNVRLEALDIDVSTKIAEEVFE